MKVERRENGVTLIPESKFEEDCLKELRKEIIERIRFEDDWQFKGKLLIDFSDGWGR